MRNELSCRVTEAQLCLRKFGCTHGSVSRFEMALQVRLDGEGRAAQVAHEGTFVGVRPEVHLQLFTLSCNDLNKITK